MSGAMLVWRGIDSKHPGRVFWGLSAHQVFKDMRKKLAWPPETTLIELDERVTITPISIELTELGVMNFLKRESGDHSAS